MQRGQGLGVTGSKGIDIQAPTSRVARINGQLRWLAPRPNVHKDTLYALLMKFMVLSKTDQISQQSSLIDGWPCVGDANGTPVGLTRDQTIAFKQLRAQDLAHRCLVKLRGEQMGAG